MPLCSICKSNFASVNALYLHLKIQERVNENTVFKCQEMNCWRDFANWKTFRKHLIRNHKYPIYVPNQALSGICNKANLSGISSCNEEIAVSPTISDSGNIDLSNISDNKDIGTIHFLKENVRNSLITCASKLYAEPNLPRNHIQFIIDDFHELLSDIMTNLKLVLCNSLKGTDCENIKNAVDKALTAVTEPFQDICSEYHRLKIFQEMGYYIPPQSYVIGSRIDNKLSEGRIIKEIIPVTAQFIPMRKVLYSFFSLPGVLEKTLQYLKTLKAQEDFSNFVQGEIWREKESKFFVGKDVLPIFLYYDDFEINNPLGSHAGIQKVGGMYFSIPCIPPEFRAKVENIFLCLLFYFSDRYIFKSKYFSDHSGRNQLFAKGRYYI